VKDFAKKHPVNNSKRNSNSATLRAKRELNQPLKLKHFFITAGMVLALLFTAKFLLETDVKNLRGQVGNPTVEFLYPTDLEKDSVLIESGGIVIAENCEYLLQIETYGKRIYAQEQLGVMFSLGLEAYVERTFSSSQPEKPLFRVMSGPYKTKSEVNNAREVMMKNNRQPLVITKCIKV
tara:strand:+ start:453 stop:989 length:537 start_codon:yes stop_codon:yes gene_type:complete